MRHFYILNRNRWLICHLVTLFFATRRLFCQIKICRFVTISVNVNKCSHPVFYQHAHKRYGFSTKYRRHLFVPLSLSAFINLIIRRRLAVQRSAPKHDPVFSVQRPVRKDAPKPRLLDRPSMKCHSPRALQHWNQAVVYRPDQALYLFSPQAAPAPPE